MIDFVNSAWWNENKIDPVAAAKFGGMVRNMMSERGKTAKAVEGLKQAIQQAQAA
jgi:hypothetical protein